MCTLAQGKSDRVHLDLVHLLSSTKRRIMAIIQKKERYQTNVANSSIKSTTTTAQRRRALIKIELAARTIFTIPLYLLVLHC
jgi:hypothetical protein